MEGGEIFYVLSTKCFTKIILFLLLTFLFFSLESGLERLNNLLKVIQLVIAQDQQSQVSNAGYVIPGLLHRTVPLPKFIWALIGWHTEFIHITRIHLTFPSKSTAKKKCGGRKNNKKIKQY